ncbi:MAG: helix-turn-helix domain-containing protein, partial [Ligilactobacillus ruminis]
MGRKSKYSADFKLMIIHEAETLGITRTSKYQGIQGLEPTHSNNTYSKE